MAITTQDSELLIQFRDPATKEKAYTSLIRKYQERLYWHIRRMVVEHEDANDVLQNVWDHTDGDHYPSEARDHVARIVIDQLTAELQDVCIDKCRRVDRDPMELSQGTRRFK